MEQVPTWADLSEYARDVQSGYRRHKWSSQPYHVSVWSKKSTDTSGEFPSAADRPGSGRDGVSWREKNPVSDGRDEFATSVSTISGVLRPVLREYDVPFQVAHGWCGATPVWAAARENMLRDQKTVILYVGDWDPTGLAMSEQDLPKWLARYSCPDPSNKAISDKRVNTILNYLQLRVKRVALTAADTVALGEGPRFPASDKRKDSRHGWFVQNFGDWR